MVFATSLQHLLPYLGSTVHLLLQLIFEITTNFTISLISIRLQNSIIDHKTQFFNSEIELSQLQKVGKNRAILSV